MRQSESESVLHTSSKPPLLSTDTSDTRPRTVRAKHRPPPDGLVTISTILLSMVRPDERSCILSEQQCMSASEE